MPPEGCDYRLGECCGACNLAGGFPPSNRPDITLGPDEAFCLEFEEKVKEFMVCDKFESNEDLTRED